jgi:DNA-binding transcriptional ArsR family regulator
MDAKTQARFEARSKIIKALAHPSRLFIVDELTRGRRCVNDLAGLVEADISTVSKHLSILKGAGVVRDEKEGTRVYYSLRVPCVLNFFSCVETVMAENAREQAELLE